MSTKPHRNLSSPNSPETAATMQATHNNQPPSGGASLQMPLRPSSNRRNQESRNNYFTSYTPPSSTEAINGPVREPAREQAPASDRLIVGVDFGTTFSG